MKNPHQVIINGEKAAKRHIRALEKAITPETKVTHQEALQQIASDVLEAASQIMPTIGNSSR